MLFLFQDPLGDDHGLGYFYPRAALFQEAGEGYADLLALAGEAREGRLVLRVRLARYPNPLGGPLGFSLATVVLYLDTAPGGREELDGLGLRTPPGQGYEVAYVLTGFGGEKRTPEGERAPLIVRRVGDWLELDTGLLPGAYGYYLGVGLFDPFVPWYLRPTRPEGGPWSLMAPPGSPPAVDLLALRPDGQVEAYQTGVLNPVREEFHLRRESLLAFGLGGLALILGFLLGRRP